MPVDNLDLFFDLLLPLRHITGNQTRIHTSVTTWCLPLLKVVVLVGKQCLHLHAPFS